MNTITSCKPTLSVRSCSIQLPCVQTPIFLSASLSTTVSHHTHHPTPSTAPTHAITSVDPPHSVRSCSFRRPYVRTPIVVTPSRLTTVSHHPRVPTPARSAPAHSAQSVFGHHTRFPSPTIASHPTPYVCASLTRLASTWYVCPSLFSYQYPS